jgi:ribosomal protein S12 methylthiotransferase
VNTIGLVSLGCAKNQVDSEVMLGLLRRRGFEVTHRPDLADIIVVNTCGFLEAAKEEGLATIREMANLKKKGRCRKLVVAGCLVQRRAAELKEQLPEVDQFLALNDMERVAEACDPDGEPFEPDPGPATWLNSEGSPRVISTAGPSAYLKIAEGCDNPCSFCVIPSIRGRFRSRSLESLVEESRVLATAGVRELNLIAQDTTSYGSDSKGGPGLPDLLRALSSVVGISWIRLLYAYPNRMSRELMETLGATPGVLPYLDIPLQHASRTVLSRMGRGGSGDSFSRILAELRQRAPGISVRSTFITGFPGETEEEFEELLRFVEEMEFDHIGVFTYSHESGALSFGMKDDVPEDLKSDRRQVLLDLQEEITGRRYRELTGSEVEVLVEGDGPEPGTLVGRAAFQAPEVDGNVVFRCSPGTAGPFTRVLVEEAWPYALYGRDATSPVSPGLRPLPVVS